MSSPAIRLWLPLFLAAAALPSHGQERFRQLHRMFPAKDDQSYASTTFAAKLVDVDGDGDRDVLTAAVGSKGGLFTNDGSGVFSAVGSAVPPSSGPDLATADLDGDGDVDAFVPHLGPDQVFRNDGAGRFTQVAGAVPTDNAGAMCVALGDVDQDGDTDALVGNLQTCASFECTTGWGALYLNNGAATFQQSFDLPLTAFNARGISMGDLDGDGDLDGVAACELYHGVLLLGDGAGSFTEATGAPQPSELPSDIPLADVDGDGDLDAVIGNLGSSSSLWLNDGLAAFTGVTGALPSHNDYTDDVFLKDVDGDGDVDAALANYGEDRLFLNTGAGVYVDAPVPLPPDDTLTTTVCLEDVDGDGDADAFFGGKADRLCLNDGAGVFVDSSSALPYVDWIGGAALGDVDGDGDADAVLAAFDGVDRLYLNNGAGSLSEAPTGFPADPFSSSDVALGDVDGDGDADVLVGAGCAFSGGPDLDRLYVNDGAGVFGDATANLPSVLDCTNAVALGDLDQDGDLDAFLGNSIKNRVYANDGAGVFVDVPSSLPADNGNTAAVALGEVDGNGSLDALVTSSASLKVQLLLNSGTGVFLDASAHLPPLIGAGAPAVALCDVDGDLDLDAWIGVDGFGSQTRLLKNNGASFFFDATASVPAGPGWTHALAPGDLDGDGDLDLLLGNYQQDSFWRNDGGGVFSDASTELVESSEDTTALALQDLDGDGDLDVLSGSDLAPSRVLANLTRQVAWRGLPRLGKPLDLDLWGTPGAPWFLAASLGAVSIPLPPFGTLLIDPAQLLILGSGLLDGAGRAAPHLLVPDQPGLLGVAVRWQGLLGSPLLFSNLELTVLTGF